MNVRTVATVNFQGTVVAFARSSDVLHRATALDAADDDALTTDLYYDVLALDVASRSDASDWTGFQRLALPDAVRPAGMTIINVPVEYSASAAIDGLRDAGQPFRVVATADYIYLVRQAARGTLLVNRLRLVREVADGNPQAVSYRLEPAWEVRFQRSGKPDTPADATDTQSYTSPDHEPFIEPAYELFMIGGLVDGNFDVALLPRGDGPGMTFAVFVADAARGAVDTYQLALDSAGLFTLADKTFVAGTIPPDFSFQLRADGQAAAMPLTGRPSAAFYLKQERVLAAGGDSFLIKRSGRLMLALQAGAPVTLGVVDLALASDGTLAVPAAQLVAAPVGVANYAVELDAAAYIALPAFAPTAGFSIDTWIYPAASEPARQLIVGNASDPGAPRLSLVSGTGLELAFLGADGKQVACTATDAVRQQAWSHVLASFDPAADPGERVVISVNGAALQLTGDDSANRPAGGAIDSLGASSGGFLGLIDSLTLYAAPYGDPAHVVGDWPLDAIDYVAAGAPVDPPQTPNRVPGGGPGLVHGGHLVVSTSPAQTRSPALSWDARGLTIYSSYFADLATYGELRSSPALLAGSDGIMHCYFRGRDDAFSVMQLDTEVARATFAAPWQTAAGAAEQGTMQFIATHPGKVMNTASAAVSPAAPEAPPVFCDVVLGSPSGRIETWSGVPRSLAPFAAVLAGESVDDPADPRIATGARIYFDPTGTRTAAYVAVPGSATAAALGAVSRQVSRMPLAGIEITAGGAATRVALTFAPPRWPDVQMIDVWPDLPVRITDLLVALSGAATGYRYQGNGYSNVASYSLPAFTQLVGAHRVVLFTHPVIDAVHRIAIRDGAATELCDVTIALGRGGVRLEATWPGVPRLQTAFATTLEGTNPAYDYARATGDWRVIGEALVITTDGSSAALDDADLGGAGDVPPDDDLRVSASLFAALTTGAVGPAELVPATPGRVPATAFQRAEARPDAAANAPIGDGSQIFRAVAASQPAQGAAGLVQDTPAAALVVQGFDGGWRNQPGDRTLAFAWDNWVEFDTRSDRAPDIAALTIQGDLTLELWCRPTGSREDSMLPNQRLVTFSRTPDRDEGGAAVQFLAGLVDTPSLVCNTDTTVRAGFASVSGTFYAWFQPIETPAGGVIGSISTLGLVTPAFAISLDADRRVRVDFLLRDSGALVGTQPPIIAPPQIAAGTWHQVALAYAITSATRGSRIDYTITAALYLDGELAGQQVYRLTRTSDQRLFLATLVLGDVTSAHHTLPMLVNEVALFERAITGDEVAEFAGKRIPDSADGLVLKWMLLDGASNRAHNSAPTGAAYDGIIAPEAAWRDWGLYSRPVLGHGDNLAVLRDDPIIRGWSHLALVHQAGYALYLQGRNFADCGSDASLNLGDTLSLEAWVQPGADQLNAPQVLVGKGDDYELAIDPAGKPRFRVAVTIDDDDRTLELVGPSVLPADRAAYLAASYQIATISAPDGQAALPRYEVHMDLYVDGQRVAWGIQDPDHPGSYQQFDHQPSRRSSDARVNLGRSALQGGSSYLRGYLADVRLWTRVLTATEVAGVFASRRAPSRSDGLVAYWRFAETDGKIAFDSVGNNNARLDRADLRVLYRPTANNWFYVDGAAATTVEFVDSPAAVGGYGTGDQFRFARVTGTASCGFFGQLDEVRLWAAQRTQEQLTDNMNQPLTGGEPQLRGYWNFDNGSGRVVEDRTGRGNTGALASVTGTDLPVWGVSSAPLADEAPVVFNILGGVETYAQIHIADTPAVVDYADVQRDAYGALFSVMKRAYVAIEDGAIALTTGFKIGDLDTVYLGQAQSQPSLIGFIEGAPPVPSENQTMPYWLGGYSSLNQYAGASSVSITEADNVTYTYNTDRATGSNDAFHRKGGLYVAGQYGASAGIGFEVEARTLVFEGHLGAQAGDEIGSQTTGNVNVQNGSALSLATGLAPAGTWEPGTSPDGWVNPTVGRRYVPANNGLALVKSLTVDVYASILRSTGAMVKLTMVPDPAIPADVNLIDFPIDPRYVKNGTLDGKVGLANDPDYPNADRARGSYFQPLEAYALKRQIERESAQLEAYYQQLDAGGLASRLGDGGAWDDYRNTSRLTSAYDWSRHLARRSIVNTYVWTAGGGSYAEQTQPMNVYSESYGAIASRSWQVGAVFDLQMAFPVAGFYLDFDYLHTQSTQVTAVKSKQEGASFALAAAVNPEKYLYAPRIDAGGNVTFGDSPTEGKVDDYRYLAFYLAPSQDNADAFFDQVVDPNWLANSRDASAAALREATVADNGAWRVLYRVTYVSRIPPRFQPVPAASQPPAVQPPANLTYNALMVQLVDDQLATDSPTPLQIGEAIAAVLGTPGAPGVLAHSLPWWPEFLTDTQDYRLPAAAILRALREDLLAYMLAYHAA